jgi:mono/diheme cytochrome c family protein
MLRAQYLIAVSALIALFFRPEHAQADAAQIARGRYLVQLGGCSDCHTPGYFLGKPDMNRYLGGSDVGFQVPNVGVFVGRNLTPDPETGLGSWTSEQITKTLRTGVRPDGRVLSTIMPWPALANLTRDDMDALVAFLRSLRPVKNKVPGPFGAKQEPSVFVMTVIPPRAAGKTAVH